MHEHVQIDQLIKSDGEYHYSCQVCYYEMAKTVYALGE